MIHELRIYTIRAGTLMNYVDVTEKIGMPIRQDRFGVLRGYWTTKVGQHNQVVHLWEYPDLNTRMTVRATMMSNERWLNEFIPNSLPYIVAQQNCLMIPVEWNPSQTAEPSGTYELQTTQLKPGTIGKWAETFKKQRRAVSDHAFVALWAVEVGPLNTAMHLWRLPDGGGKGKESISSWLNDDASLADAIAGSSSTVMSPSSFSPLR